MYSMHGMELDALLKEACKRQDRIITGDAAARFEGKPLEYGDYAGLVLDALYAAQARIASLEVELAKKS